MKLECRVSGILECFWRCPLEKNDLNFGGAAIMYAAEQSYFQSPHELVVSHVLGQPGFLLGSLALLMCFLPLHI